MGAGDAGEIALREIKNNSDLGYIPIGFIDDNMQKIGRRIHGVPILGTRKELDSFVQKYDIEEILITIQSAEPVRLTQIIMDCRATGAAVRVMPRTVDSKVGLVRDQLPKQSPHHQHVVVGSADLEKKETKF
jgi:FlaA1/EpsC-like NDP-sugar epimerase